MNLRFFQLLAGLLIAGLVTTIQLYGQQTAGPEAEYARIRETAFSGDLSAARVDARKLVNAFPSYGDARILLGRIIAWQNEYAEALAVIDTLLALEPENADALSARNDIQVWMKTSSPAEITVRGGYSFDYFREPWSRFWQILSAGAGKDFKWGTGYAGVNAGYLIAGEPSPAKGAAIQFEADAYPKLSQKNYAYLAYAISPGTYFPKHRASFEIWHILPRGWSVSAGLNYFYFDRNIFIISASGEKYLGNYWFSLKGYLYFKDDGPTVSGHLNARKYLNDTDYLQAGISSGTAPDEPFDIQADLMRLSANAVRFAYSRRINTVLTLKASAGYSIEEYDESAWRSRFDGGITLIYGIKGKK